jgi:putative chitinase
MGNTEPGDGYKFRGRGFLMTTGRAEYRELGAALNLDLEANPDLLLDPKVNARAAAYIFARRTEAQRKSGNLDLAETFVAISGGVAGLDDKRLIYERLMRL